MKQIVNFEDLQFGQRIARATEEGIETFIFICIDPLFEDMAVFRRMEESKSPLFVLFPISPYALKVYTYPESDEDWKFLRGQEIDLLAAKMEKLQYYYDKWYDHKK